MPTQGSNTAALLLAAILAAPASAAPNVENRCDDVADATLTIAVHELNAEIVSHDVDLQQQKDAESLAPAEYLAPETEANLREVFEDTRPPVAGTAPASSETSPVSDNDDSDERVMKTRLHGVTDSELARYRRQMYRIDI